MSDLEDNDKVEDFPIEEIHEKGEDYRDEFKKLFNKKETDKKPVEKSVRSSFGNYLDRIKKWL
jgi:hypothetical protein